MDVAAAGVNSAAADVDLGFVAALGGGWAVEQGEGLAVALGANSAAAEVVGEAAAVGVD